MGKKEEPVLVQCRVTPDVRKKLDQLAKATKRTRANYVAALIENHVESITPELAGSLHQSWNRIEKGTR